MVSVVSLLAILPPHPLPSPERWLQRQPHERIALVLVDILRVVGEDGWGL